MCGDVSQKKHESNATYEEDTCVSYVSSSSPQKKHESNATYEEDTCVSYVSSSSPQKKHESNATYKTQHRVVAAHQYHMRNTLGTH